MRDRIRSRYENWSGGSVLPIGRLSEYSSLRKLLIEKYKIIDASFDRRQAAPRFVIRPTSQFCYEGQSVKFYCRVIAVATPTLTWSHNNQELRQSVKFMKRYGGDDYYFIINRVRLDDRGEYIIRADNHYGAREEVVFLNVHPLPKEPAAYRPDEPTQTVRRRQPLPYQIWQEESETAPSFTFLLRPRVMQARDTCKLLCCLSGRPTPTVKWYKDRRELSKYEYSMSHSDGVVTMEIIDCKPGDSGKYSCIATNCHGTDETSCVVIVEGKINQFFDGGLLFFFSFSYLSDHRRVLSIFSFVFFFSLINFIDHSNFKNKKHIAVKSSFEKKNPPRSYRKGHRTCVTTIINKPYTRTHQICRHTHTHMHMDIAFIWLPSKTNPYKCVFFFLIISMWAKNKTN